MSDFEHFIKIYLAFGDKQNIENSNILL